MPKRRAATLLTIMLLLGPFAALVGHQHAHACAAGGGVTTHDGAAFAVAATCGGLDHAAHCSICRTIVMILAATVILCRVTVFRPQTAAAEPAPRFTAAIAGATVWAYRARPPPG